MNVRQHIQAIRVQLFQMSKLSQCAVDNSIKACELRSKEACHHVHSSGYELGLLHRSVAERCRKLLAAGLSVESDLCFTLSSLRLCTAFHRTYSATVAIVQNTLFSLEDDRISSASQSPVLREMAQIVNCLVGLCTVALSEEEIQHAKRVLKNDDFRRCFLSVLCQAHDDVGQQNEAQNTFELAIAKSLARIAEQAHEMADAIASWLEETDCTAIMHKHDLQEIAACR